ncbi:MAG TPA: ABC transporter ATP-binding protein [Bacteroidales bacterium]|jgi:ABC-2 type transport system ATP-binding protein|nr:ABC transporter ATP-binding protein [Bacteroidales bacterium]
MDESIVKVSNLSHRYAIQWAIRDIDFEINRKGVYGLLGANGSGKSTIMNIMCGILKQSRGDVFIRGINVSENPIAAKKHIGFLPQQAPLHPDLTVEEYLTHAANMRLMDGKSISNAVEETMERCGVSHFRKRLIRNLSGGYKQRVGIAQAIVHNPEFIVLDEPTNGLDPNQILEVRNLIKAIAQEHTVLLSTHILQEVQAMCDYIWMINEGQQVFSGTVDEFDSYITPNSLIVSFATPPAPDKLEAIHGVEGVEEVSFKTFRVRYSDEGEVTEAIVTKSVENGWHLREIRVEKISMDSVFAELSKNGKK